MKDHIGDRGDTIDDAGVLIDGHVGCQDWVEVEGAEGVVADGAVEQWPVSRSKSNRKPKGKYDPAVYYFDSIEITEMPMSGSKNGFRGAYCPQ